MLEAWRRRVKELKNRIGILYLAVKHPRTPWYVKVLATLVVAYALSPIDFIPDFIPILGFLDELLLLPFGIWLTLKLVPPEIWLECQQQAEQQVLSERPRNWTAAVVIVLLWLLILYCVGWMLMDNMGGGFIPISF
jgi:uncharacterized membrane protein YkvA (DUF1232 family)